jgi:predicted site-specific integrase-resolvase
MFITTGEAGRRYKEQGVTQYIAKGWAVAGKVKGMQTPGGHWKVDEDDIRRLVGLPALNVGV